MTTERHIRFWVIGLAIFILSLFLLRTILLPFVAGMAIAYFLDPLCDRLERWGLSRALATALVMLFFAIIVVVALLLIFPLLQQQFVALAQALPGYIKTLQERAVPLLQKLEIQFAIEPSTNLQELVSTNTERIISWLANAAGQIIAGGTAIANILSLIFITPVVTFYLLRDWDKLVKRLNAWLPRRYASVIREQARTIDRTLAAFARGQSLVCLCLAGIYGGGLSLVGLNFGFAVGLIAGVLSFVPYLGTITGFVTAMILALGQFDSGLSIGLTAIVFVVGQIMEGYVLTPRLVGERVGLHPVWVIFAILAGGALFGFVGILLAVPIAAIIGVLVRFSLDRYLQSRFYDDRGASPSDPSPNNPSSI